MNDMFGLGAGMGVVSVIVTIVPFAIIAVVFLWLALRARNKTRSVQDWPETVGKVLHSEVEMRRSRSGTSGYSTAYYPKVLYEYEVGGQRYQSQQISAGFQMGLGNQATVQNQVAQYPPGTSIRIYFNPNNPAQSILDKSANPATSIFSGIAVFIMVVLCGTTALMAGIFYFVYRVIGEANSFAP